MSKYYIGIDGGGTNTLGALYDEKGNEIIRIENGYANFSVSVEVTMKNIEHTIDALLNRLNESDEILHIQLGIAGISKLPSGKGYENYLKDKYNTSINLTNDAEIALYSVKKNRNMNVIMILGGTGSIIMKSEDNVSSILGGFGHLLGDEGSSYHLSINALKNIVRENELDMEYSLLSKAILKEINCESHYDIKNFVYNGSKKDIAKLSLFISQFALEGNKEAIELFVTQGKHLARQAFYAYNKFEKKENVMIGFKGGFLLNAPHVIDTIISELNKYKINYEICKDDEQPVKGAYYLGLTKISKR
jgi:N-acetylglucosamine kinase-like BadF-type ATPase